MTKAARAARFDAELYLRLLGEETVLDPEHGFPNQGGPLAEAARALAAVGAIRPAIAQGVLDDYTLAGLLRGDPRHRHWMRHRRAASSAGRVKPLSPERVVACRTSYEDAGGALEVRYALLSRERTAVGIRWRPAAGGTGAGRRRGPMMVMRGPGPPRATLADDRGTSAAAHFSGGGGEYWDGLLTAEHPLHPDTAWLELDGHRVELSGEPWPCEVTVEALPDARPAHRYLWHRLAVVAHFGGPRPAEVFEPAIAALVASGQLGPEDPMPAEFRAVAEARSQGHPRAASGGTVRVLPQPWRSLLARGGRMDGPELSLVLGATTPVFDGFSVRVVTLESAREQLGLEVEVRPGIHHHGPLVPPLAERELAWWAADDRGNHYLGAAGRWASSDEESSGEVNLWPALDPRARELRLMPTGPAARAVVTIPLPSTEAAA